LKIKVVDFREKMALMAGIVSKNPTLPITKNIWVGKGKLICNNLEMMLTVDLPMSDDQEPCLIPYAEVMDLLKYTPGNEVMILTQIKNTVKVSWGTGSSTFGTDNPVDFPFLEKQEPVSAAQLNGNLFIDALQAAAKYAADESDQRSGLKGSIVYLGDTIQVAGADGFRLSYQSLNLKYPEKGRVTIPIETVKTLAKLWQKAPGSPNKKENFVKTVLSPKQLELALLPSLTRISWTGIEVIFKQNESAPPDFLALMATFKESIKVKFYSIDLLAALRRMSRVAKDSSSIVKIIWDNDYLSVYAGGEKNETSSRIDVDGSGPGRIGLNINYLIEYLADKEGLVEMGWNSKSEPVSFHFNNHPYQVIMPMNVQAWPDDPVKPPEETKTETTQAATSETVSNSTQEETAAVDEEDPEGSVEEPIGEGAEEVPAAEGAGEQPAAEEEPVATEPKKRKRKVKTS